MKKFTTGMLVRHTTLGVGRVVAVEKTAVHVYFAGAETRQASKLSLAVAGPLLEPDPGAQDERLEGLPGFSLDPVSGRYVAEKVRGEAKPRKKKAKAKTAES
ncbi:MAG: hypothetical protein QM767_19555 [Anaeromyxobacter sp.]